MDALGVVCLLRMEYENEIYVCKIYTCDTYYNACLEALFTRVNDMGAETESARKYL